MKTLNIVFITFFFLILFLNPSLKSQSTDFNSISFSDIQSANMFSDRINGSNNTSNKIPVGTIVLYKTNEGRFGKFFIKEYGYNLKLKWKTYTSNGNIYSEGDNIVIRGTWSCDLDLGRETQSFNDFWWEQVTSVERYLTPKNGAKFTIYISNREDLTISIWNINIKKFGSKQDYGERVRNIAQEIAKKDNDRNMASNLFGIVEAYHQKVLMISFPPWSRTYHYIREPILCPTDGGHIEKYTHHCFFDKWFWSLNIGLRGSSGIQMGAMGHQYGDVAILASRDVFEIEAGTDYITENHGPIGWGITQFKLIGIRLKIKRTDFILPFYTVHVTTAEAGRPRQKESCEDIIKIVKDNWVSGDLTPVVVGDFNFTKKAAPEEYNIMKKYFTEVGMNYDPTNPVDAIEHVWVGKKENFSGAIGELIAVDYNYDTTFATKFGKTGIATGSDGPFLYNTNERLYMAWSQSALMDISDDFKIYVSHWTSSTDGINWDDIQFITSSPGTHTPSLDYFNDKFYIAWTSVGKYLNIMSYDGKTWGNKIEFTKEPNKATSNDGPSLLVANNQLHIIWSGSGFMDRLIWMSTSDGRIWTAKKVIGTDDCKSKHSPSLAYFNGKFYVAWTALNNYLNIISYDGKNWGNKIEFTKEPNRATSNDGPSLLVANNQLHIIWSGSGFGDRLIWMSTSDGRNWTAKKVIGTDDCMSKHSPSSVYFNGKFYVAWTNPEDPFHLKIISSYNGEHWGNKITFRADFPGYFTDHPAPRADFKLPY